MKTKRTKRVMTIQKQRHFVFCFLVYILNSSLKSTQNTQEEVASLQGCKPTEISNTLLLNTYSFSPDIFLHKALNLSLYKK